MEPASSIASVPVPPVPHGNWVDPYARTESMTHRGRYSYASSAISTINSPQKGSETEGPDTVQVSPASFSFPFLSTRRRLRGRPLTFC